MDENLGIGIHNQLPWYLSDDLKRFRALTMGHHIVMGRKTYESIGGQLPGRTMIVVTHNPEYPAEGVLMANSLTGALEQAETRGENEVFIIGGAEIFAQSMAKADHIYLTQVHTIVDADVFFPKFDRDTWIEKESLWKDADEKNQYPVTFKLLVKKNRQLT
jgi:dihydrofolate reductase